MIADRANPVRGRHLDALRALALYPRGLRHSAYPSAMPVLLELGYIEERPARGRRDSKVWHLTEAGRDDSVPRRDVASCSA